MKIAFERWFDKQDFDEDLKEVARMAWWAGLEYERLFQYDLDVLTGKIKEKNANTDSS